MSSLPVAAVLPALLDALSCFPQVLLTAPTGAGKSTWLPLQILQQAQISGRILLLEPRRLAARNVAQRMAEQLGEPVGKTVGYRMRMETCVSTETRIEVVTEGILTRMIQHDPELLGIDLVILDEFHERSLQADLALALLLDVQTGLRHDLRILVMSATLDTERLERCLPDAPLIHAEGRTFPVDRRYVSLPVHLRQDEAIARAVVALMQDEQGSLLLFLPGIGEIHRVQTLLQERIATDVLLCPLYGGLSLEAQRQAIIPAPTGRRKIVLATNIAETSLTISGIRLVVDSTFERVAQFDACTGLTQLVTQRISQSSMTQRAGRAGRLEAGVCLHLMSAEQAERAAIQSEPEMLTHSLTSLSLELALWGCRDMSQLRWLDQPPPRHLAAAQQKLRQLGATDDQGGLTAKGAKMAQFGCEPALAHMLVSARDADESTTAALLVALLEERQGRSLQADIRLSSERLSLTQQQRMKYLLRRLGNPKGEVRPSMMMSLLAHAFPDNLARRRGSEGRYQLASGRGAILDKDDGLYRHEWLIAPLLLQGSNSPDARILQALPLDILEFEAQCADLIRCSPSLEWDTGAGTLKALNREQVGKLVIRVRPLEKPSEEVMQQALLTMVRERGLRILNWSDAALQLRLRMQCAARWFSDQSWPAVDDDSLLTRLEEWLLPEIKTVRSLSELSKVDMVSGLLHLLDWSLRQRLNSTLPAHYTVPTGSKIAIRYREDAPPVLSVRMQEMFGESVSPVIAEGRIRLVLELLSPARRPLQVTQDLAAFWQGAYREVQKEMKGRYPKHVWPDDPARTQPTRRTKKYQ